MEDLLYFSYNDKSSILLIFFFNALVFSSLLLIHGIKENERSSKWLALFIFLGGLYLGPFLFGYANWYAKQAYKEFLLFIPLQQLFLMGPVLYFYVKSLVDSEFKLSKRDYWHFVPAGLYLIYSLVIFITDKLILDEFYFYAVERDKDLAFWYQMSGLVSMLVYLVLSLGEHSRFRKRIVNEVSYADALILRWIRLFLIAFSAILILRVLFFILNPEWGEFGRKYWYYLCFAILFFYMALAGYTHAIKSSIRTYLRYRKALPEENKEEPASNSQMPSTELDAWKAKILRYVMDKKAYANPGLTLTDIASGLQTNRNVISQVINQGFQMNFNDFINAKRVEAVIARFEKGEQHQKTLLGIALECGFNSKATFNRAFKKHTDRTPKQFLNSLG